MVTSQKFQNPDERFGLVAQLLHEAKSENHRTRAAVMACWEDVAYSHYPLLSDYAGELQTAVLAAMEDSERDVATKAIDFWSTVAEEEMKVPPAPPVLKFSY